jgi:hypothetical protein
MSVLVIVNIANWPVHTMQTALGLPSQQLAGTVANAGVALTVIGIAHDSLSATTFSMALVAGALGQCATQATLLWRSARLRYSAREGIAIALLLGCIAIVAVLGDVSPTLRALVGSSIALAWAMFAMSHYLAHRV